MTGVVSDTHGAIWYLADDPRLSAAARAALIEAIQAGGSILVASITLVEMTYLIEKRRIDPEALAALELALDDPASGFELVPLDRSVASTLRLVPRAAVPDMPDRIIAATALHLGLQLVSRDRKITASAIQTIW